MRDGVEVLVKWGNSALQPARSPYFMGRHRAFGFLPLSSKLIVRLLGVRT